MKRTAPLSKSQYGLYVECVEHQGEAYYNLSYLYVLDGSLDEVKLKTAIETAVAAHPTLFTRIELNEQGDPIQSIDDSETFSLQVEHIADIKVEKQSMVVPFDIYNDRLFHIRLLKDHSRFYLLLDIHHIICDGTSLKVILNDIDAAYNGQTPETEALTLADVACTEVELRQAPAYVEDKQWYAQNFDCGDCYSPLLPDLEETEPKEGLMSRTLSVSTESVDAFCKEHGIFKSTFFTAVYSYLLAKYNNEREALFSTVYSGRTDKRLEHTVAMLVKTLPVYAKFTDDTTVLEFLKAGQQQMAGCRQHDSYSFSDVISDLNLQIGSYFAWHGSVLDNVNICGKPTTAIQMCNTTLEVPFYIKALIRDGHYCVEAEYKANLYSKEIICQFLESYEAVVEGFLAEKYLRNISIVTKKQVELLDSFNQNDVPYDDTQTIVSLFSQQVKATPDNIAVVYKDKKYTYGEVDEISDRIAAFIREKGIVKREELKGKSEKSETVVSVLIPRSEWMVIASLGVLKAGCAYQPLDPSYPKERLNFMMQDADAKLLIADEELRPLVDEYQGEVLFTKDFNTLPEVTTPVQADITPSSLFIMLYTSGSTGVPKGCQLEHGNLVCFCHWYQRYYHLTPESHVAAYASYGFDACMMDMYPALTCGATVYIVQEELRLDLIALNEYFEQNSISHSFITTQVGYQFATSIENGSLRHLSVGGEKLATLTPPTRYQFYNCYGPTECTIFTTTYMVSKRLKEIPIGKPTDNTHLYVVDSQGRRVPVGAAGELLISGPQVSRGYLNRPEKTAEVYIRNPFSEDVRFARCYRSGDIVRYLPDGNIQFVGRRDGQVKIRGFRIELKEVEAVIREFPGIKDATVQAFDVDDSEQQSAGGGKYIAAYIVSDEQVDIEALNNFILDRKPPYMVPAVTMQIEAIPLNQNQKVNKKALPKPVKSVAVSQQQAEQTPLNELEQELFDIIAAIVNTTDFGITTKLSYVGITSISAIKLAVLVNKRYGVTLDAKTIVKNCTIQTIENEIWKRVQEAGMTLHPSTAENDQPSTPDAPKTCVPLSYAQTGVYIECVSNPTSTVYNIPFLLSFPTDIEAAKLADAVKKVVEAHPELSVHFTTEGDTVMQTLADSVPVSVPVTEMSDQDLDTYKREFVRPFDLQKPPLYRFEVVKTDSGVKLLMDVHHLVFDGGSADLFIHHIISVLENSAVGKETYTYFDFVADQQKNADSDDWKASQQFFAEKLQNCEGASEIPADLPNTDRQGFIGEATCPVDHEKMVAFCRQQDITPAHLFLAAISYAVSRYTNSREVYLSTISSGRSNLKIADTVGMFVNTLALGLIIEDVTVSEYLKQVGENFDETLRHENYPFARIAGDFGFRPAIFFAYQVGVLSAYTVGGKPIEQETLELNVPKFKINILIESRGVVVQYDDSLYSAQLGNALAESIVAIAEQMMKTPQAKVRQLSMVSQHQEEELSHVRQVASGDAPFKFFHDCIGHFAQTQPEQEAMVACDATYTYREMDFLTNRMANGLRQRGVKRGDRVALLLPRTSRLILSMFGVMKAGAAYIPCDPDYPADRVKLILEDSEAKLTVTPELAEELLTSPVSCDTVATDITPDDLAYLIYTSGSTGRPKGVMLRHEGICNYLYGHSANVLANAVLTDATRILSVTTISFDAALQDIGMAYYNGKTLILATEEQANNPMELAQLIREQHIDMVSGTPSRWQTWLTSDDFCQAIGGVKICRAGGEKYPAQLLDQLRSLTKARLFNCYGPTEITVASNNAELTDATMITAGKPQLNVKEFIVDVDGNELPVGVVGELYIGGKGVARGYNNLDEMTRERFIDYHGTRIYKSGDYAKWLPDGNVVILGRTDHQIKLRGLRIELGEVENAILQVEGVKQVVVTIRQIGGTEHLCAYFTVADGSATDGDSIAAALRASSLTDYMVPTAYMRLDRMPMTPNGKTDVRSLPDPVVQSSQGTSGETSSRRLTLIEKELQGMVKEVLGIDDVDVECPLGMVGLTSLSAIRMAILVQQRYGVTLQAKQMVRSGSLMSIEDDIIREKVMGNSEKSAAADGAEADTSSSMPHSSFPLSYAQTGVYFDCLKNPTAIQYNIPHLVTLPKDTDTGALAEAIRTLIGRHPQLTAHFEQTGEGIVQAIDPQLTIDIPVKTMSDEQLQLYKPDFVRPFDLATGPLCRFEIVTTAQDVCLLFDVHHLVFDGGSTDIFISQLCSLLDGSPIEDEVISYPAYVMAEKAAEDSEDYQAAKAFFKEQLSVVEAATEVRPDLPNPVLGTVSQAIAPLDFATIQSQLSAVNSQQSTIVTPAHLTLSAVYYALSRFANSEQVCITTVSNGRSDLRTRNTVGMFVNTLAMTATVGKQTVREFLQEVSGNFDETLNHENYPFAQIAADYGLTPEIQFVYQIGVATEYTVGGTPLKIETFGTQIPKFPITFFIAPVDGQPCVCVAYDNGKYSARLMQSLADAVKVTVERMIAKPDTALTSISIVSDEEAERIIKIGTGKEIDVDLSKTFANLFTEQAKRTPDAPAVVDRDSQLTYAEMDCYSNALARQLIDFGVQPNDFVCVMLDRVKEFPLAVLAIHKAGAAYTPLDFEYPNERLSYMLENSESKVLITSHDVLEAKQAERLRVGDGTSGMGDFSTAAAKTFFIDDFMLSVVGDSPADAIDLSTPDGLAYMIYTSGSTGKPKGAMLHQAGLRNFIAVVIDMEKLTADDRISGHRSFSFDAHIEDMYPVLTLGGSFHIMPTEIRKDLAAIRQFLIDHKCTGGGYSTAMTSLLLNTFDDLPIRFTTGGGEKMDGVYSDHIEIINVYGPTECTDDTSYYSIAPGCRVENIPIGQSVANNWNFIVDTAGNLVPQGVAGELCFAGVQVGRGYWRLPERTATSFVDCPFVREDRWGRPVRMYHTGDLCRWNEDGQLEYMGRIDTQVKLRGFRIELGEIESKALNIEGVRQAAAEVRKVMGNEHLVLYYTVVDGSPIDSDSIASALKASSLADYMVPDAYMQMDSMPMTPNGKINRKALPAPELKRATEYEAPKGEMEELFCSIFSDILKIKEVGATDNFFEIGGTSINAIKVIVEASKHGVQIVFNDLFNLKTPRALAAFVSDSETSGATNTVVGDSVADISLATPETEHYAPLNTLLAANTLASFRNGKRQPIGDVLLTGATGYLGIHILNELLTNYHGKILCPVRAKGNDEALSRIKTLYFYYFGRTEAFSHFDERVTAFAAEITQPDALEKAAEANPSLCTLQSSLTVVNCVANVKHFSAGNDIEMVNIESVRHLVSFCLHTGARLVHISTNSVAGMSINDVPGPEVKLTERDFDIGQHVSDRKYTYSKFKAEELVLDAIAHHGLNAKIMRVGNLSARQKDGEFQINFNTNNFLALLRAFVVIGVVPYEKLDMRFEFSPIDEVARAVMLLAQTPQECVVFHPYNTHRQFLSDVLSGFAEAGIQLKRVETEEFSERLNVMMDNPELVTLLRPLMAYNLGGNRKVRNIETTNDYTTQVLYRLGFQWPTTAADYVHRFVDTIVGFDYFTVAN